MDPISIAVAAAAAAPELATIGAVLGAGGTAYSAISSSQAASAQAAADRQKADLESKMMDERAKEERSGAQRVAAEELRKARFAQSRLGAVAGASGSGTTDETVMKLWGDIGKEGSYNASQATAAGEQKASGLNYQANLDRWSADANGRIKEAAGRSTLIGGLMSSAGGLASGLAGTSKMGMRYGGYTGSDSDYTYGRRPQGYR